MLASVVVEVFIVVVEVFRVVEVVVLVLVVVVAVIIVTYESRTPIISVLYHKVQSFP